MDQSAKTLGQLIVLFMAVFLILSLVAYYFTAANARSSAYAIVEYLEISGLDAESLNTIEEYARSANISAVVSLADSGIHASGDKVRYRVDVSFNHVFSVLNFGKNTTYTLYTRAVEY